MTLMNAAVTQECSVSRFDPNFMIVMGDAEKSLGSRNSRVLCQRLSRAALFTLHAGPSESESNGKSDASLATID